MAKRKPKPQPTSADPPRTLDDVIVTVVTGPPRTLDDLTVKKGSAK